MAGALSNLLGIERNPNALTLLPLAVDEAGDVSFAIPSMAYDAGDALLDAFTLPADVYAGRREPTVEDATNFSLSLLGSSFLAPAPKNALRSGAAYLGDPRLIKNPRVVREMMEQDRPEAGFGGQLSNLKHKPLSEMEYEFVPTEGGLLVNRTVTPEQIAEGGKNVIIPLVGDRTRAGGVVTSIGGKRLETPVDMQGGYQFGQSKAQMDDESVWASAGGIPQGIQNQVDLAGRDADNVYLGYVSMGGKSDSVSHHMADALLEQIKVSPLTKGAKKAFDKHLRNLEVVDKKTKKVTKPLKDWVGLDDPNISEYVANLTQGQRGIFTQAMDKRSWKDMGFPDVAETRLAITDPELLGLPHGYGGQFIGRGRVGSAIDENPSYTHKTYPNTLKGDYVGGLDEPLPRQIMFPEFHKARRDQKAGLVQDDRSFNIGNPSIQRLDQEWLDGVMQYYDDLQAGKFD
jgi:hypothetical protein